MYTKYIDHIHHLSPSQFTIPPATGNLSWTGPFCLSVPNFWKCIFMVQGGFTFVIHTYVYHILHINNVYNFLDWTPKKLIMSCIKHSVNSRIFLQAFLCVSSTLEIRETHNLGLFQIPHFTKGWCLEVPSTGEDYVQLSQEPLHAQAGVLEHALQETAGLTALWPTCPSAFIA
jgi:hypothetical protein